jgi:hypothetical protein
VGLVFDLATAAGEINAFPLEQEECTPEFDRAFGR